MRRNSNTNSIYSMACIGMSALISVACQPQFNVTKDPNAVAAAREVASTTTRTRAETFDANGMGGNALATSGTFRLNSGNLSGHVKTKSTSANFVLKGGFQGQLPP